MDTLHDLQGLARTLCMRIAKLPLFKYKFKEMHAYLIRCVFLSSELRGVF